jgi:hypothetical protein
MNDARESTPAAESTAAPDRLEWRVPTTGDPRMLRLAFAQIGMGAIVCALVLWVAVPSEWLGPALLGIVPLAIYLAYRRWQKFHAAMVGPANIRLDQAGLHWLDQEGNERTFQRQSVVAYHLGHDPDTLRSIPSLTLHLAGGFRSQPIELFPPATPDGVRSWLQDMWHIAESPADGASDEPGYDVAIDVYSECHAEFQEWHWEGTHAALSELFAKIGEAAGQLPLVPPGVRPARRVVLARRRQASAIALEHDRQPFFDDATLSGPAELLADISRRGETALAGIEPTQAKADASFDVPLGPTSRWTFHLHVRQP